VEPTIEWFGCATFRVNLRGRTLWFDTFLERGPGAASRRRSCSANARRTRRCSI
jgi:L-ascorbate metabolism protein UlaG (beta-lactamase superfamily)